MLTGGLIRSDRDKVLDLCKEMLIVWLKCQSTNDFLHNYLLKDVLSDNVSQADLVSHDILVQFFAHVDLAAGYARELCSAFNSTKPGVVPTEKEFKKFFADTYDNPTPDEISTITTLNAWIQLYSITGKCTLKYSWSSVAYIPVF